MGQGNKGRGCIPEGTSGFLKPVLLPTLRNIINIAPSANESSLAPLQMTTM